MNFRRIEYRTSGLPISIWAVIPTAYISDFLRWLELSGYVVVEVTPHYLDYANATELLSELLADRSWPSYQTCASFVRDTVIMGER